MSDIKYKTQQEMGTLLWRLDPDYVVYAAAVWEYGITRPSQLANSDLSVLDAAGINNGVHASDIKARAGVQR